MRSMELRCDRPAIDRVMRLLIVVCWSAVVPFGLAGAQGIFRPLQSLPPGRFIAAPRAVQQQLREAERALQDRRYSDAVVRLGDLLSRDAEQGLEYDLSGQDFFLEATNVRLLGFNVSASTPSTLPTASLAALQHPGQQLCMPTRLRRDT